MLEIIIHGRGGQGAQTAGNLLAQAFFREGREVQSIATYGGARRGTPVTSMIRVDDKPVRLRCDIERPDAIVCFDRTLLDARLLDRAGSDTTILVNSGTTAWASPGDPRIHPIQAVSISRRNNLGRVVNSALLGAFCRVLGTPALETMCATIFAYAPIKQDDNVAACRAGFEAAGLRFSDTGAVRESSAESSAI